MKLINLIIIIIFLVVNSISLAHESKQRSVKEILDLKGKIVPGNNGSFDVSGYQMTYGPDGEPVFNIQESDAGSSWSALGSGVGGMFSKVNALGVSGNNVFVGGQFSNAGGMNIYGIARWDGTGWDSLAGGTNGSVRSIFVSGEDIYVGGMFETVNWVNISAKHIAKWDGSSWSPLGTGLSGNVHSVIVINGDVYVGGEFITAGGGPASRIAKWDGSTWSSLDAGLNGTVYATAKIGNDLYTGGEFSTAGGIPASNIAKWETSTGIYNISTTTTDGYNLGQNYPNPFNPSTNIKFSIPQSSFVSLKVYDIAGREVASLVSQKLNSGTYEYSFDGSKLTSGTYFYKIISNDFTEVKKMVLLK